MSVPEEDNDDVAARSETGQDGKKNRKRNERVNPSKKKQRKNAKKLKKEMADRRHQEEAESGQQKMMETTWDEEVVIMDHQEKEVKVVHLDEETREGPEDECEGESGTQESEMTSLKEQTPVMAEEIVGKESEREGERDHDNSDMGSNTVTLPVGSMEKICNVFTHRGLCEYYKHIYILIIIVWSVYKSGLN